MTAVGEIERYKKSKTWINIESHSGIDSFLFNREYEWKDQKINTRGGTMGSSAGKSLIVFEPSALYLVVMDQMGYLGYLMPEDLHENLTFESTHENNSRDLLNAHPVPETVLTTLPTCNSLTPHGKAVT